LANGAAGADGRNGRDYVIDSLHAAPRTGLLGQCIRTGVPDAGSTVEDCLGGRPSKAIGATEPPVGPAKKSTGSGTGAPDPAATSTRNAPAPAASAPSAPPAAPAASVAAEPEVSPLREDRASADEVVSTPLHYDEEVRPEPDDGIMRSTIDPDFDKQTEAAAPEAESQAAESQAAESRPAETQAPEPSSKAPIVAAPPAEPPASAAEPAAEAPVAAPPPAPAAPPTPRKRLAHVTLNAATDFDFDKSILRPAGKAKLDKLMADLRSVDFSAIEVVGHTDRMGSRPYNLKLSERRADVVRAYLLARHIQPSLIEASGVGPDQPITKPGDCRNMKRKAMIRCLQPDRRVEVEVQGTREVEQ
jgi:OOP family OmpA-OmpF porin